METTQQKDSFLPSLFQGVRNAKSCRSVTWDEVFRLISGGQMREETEKHRYFRSKGLKDDAERTKKRSLCITPAVQCQGGRRPEQIVGYTGVSMVDFDHVPDLPATLALLREDPHTFMLYTTLSGEGIRVFYRYEIATDTSSIGANQCIRPETADKYNPDRHSLQAAYNSPVAKSYLSAFLHGNAYFARLTSLPYDPACKDSARLSLLCHDEGAYYNPESTPFPIASESATSDEPRVTSEPRGTSNVGADRRVRPDTADKYNSDRHTDQPLLAAHNSLVDKKIETKVLRAIARRGIAYAEGSRNAYISRAGYLLNKYGVPEEEATEWAKEKFSDYDGDVSGIIRSCYRMKEEHGKLKEKGKKGNGDNVYASVEEIEAFLNGKVELRFNIITRMCEIKQGEEPFHELTDRAVNTLWSQMCKEQKRVRLNDIYNVIHSSFTPEFNPFLNYFESLPPWDGTTDHITRLADTVHCADLGNDSQPFAESLRKWIVSMVASMCCEEVVNHQILVLVGPQGVYKTTWLKQLLPPQLSRYFYTKTNSNRLTKDDLFTISEFALICFEEIDSMTLSELNQFKAMVTLPGIHERAAYGRNKEHRAHLASFCATGNNERFLVDRSGNRRWLPYLVTHIDDPYQHPVDYTGVYSQAYALYRSGFRYWFDPTETNILNRHNADFETTNLEEELILTYYRRPIPGEECKFVTTANIMERISGMVRTPLSVVNIGRSMRRLNFKSARSSQVRGFLVKEKSQDEIRLSQLSMGRLLSEETPDEESQTPSDPMLDFPSEE